MKETFKKFSGNNLARLEANVEEFIKEIGSNHIGQKLISNNPKYQIRFDFWEEYLRK